MRSRISRSGVARTDNSKVSHCGALCDSDCVTTEGMFGFAALTSGLSAVAVRYRARGSEPAANRAVVPPLESHPVIHARRGSQHPTQVVHRFRLGHARGRPVH